MKLAIHFGIIGTAILLQICGACHNGYVRFADSCYHLSHDKENWVDAMTVCKFSGGYLAEIDSAAENNFVSGLIRSDSVVTRAWLGGNDLDVNGYYTWFNSGTQMTYHNWNTGEPNSQAGENCVESFASGLWNDNVCTTFLYYVCEMPYDGGELVG